MAIEDIAPVACVIHFRNIANSYQKTKSLLVLNMGNVLISDPRAFESYMRVYTREQPFCLFVIQYILLQYIQYKE